MFVKLFQSCFKPSWGEWGTEGGARGRKGKRLPAWQLGMPGCWAEKPRSEAVSPKPQCTQALPLLCQHAAFSYSILLASLLQRVLHPAIPIVVGKQSYRQGRNQTRGLRRGSESCLIPNNFITVANWCQPSGPYFFTCQVKNNIIYKVLGISRLKWDKQALSTSELELLLILVILFFQPPLNWKLLEGPESYHIILSLCDKAAWAVPAAHDTFRSPWKCFNVF